ncbi:MAG: SRPBCC domain-containing protein [Bacteroidota bacterium]
MQTANDMDQDKTIIRCSRTFGHPVSKVYEAFVNPALVQQWYGPKEFTIGTVNIVPEVNGSLEIELVTPKGTLWVKGIFTEMIPGVRLAYTFVYEPDMPNLGRTLVTIHFKEQGTATEVELIHTIYKTINPGGRTKGWETGFDKMEQILNQSK